MVCDLILLQLLSKVSGLGVKGLNGFEVTAEADISGGLPQFSIVGLPDSAVKEAADRVRSAAKNLGYAWPASRITVNLAPAHLRKTGPVYDLPVLLALLCAHSSGGYSSLCGARLQWVHLVFTYKFTIWPIAVILPLFGALGILIPVLSCRAAQRYSVVERLRVE